MADYKNENERFDSHEGVRPEGSFDVAGIVGPKSRDWATTPGKYRGTDTRERAYRSDVGARISPEFSNGKPTSDRPVVTTLGEWLVHPDMYAQYPDLPGLRVVLRPLGALGGAYDRASRTLYINSETSPETQRATAFHEISHAVQHIESFTGGTNPNSTEDAARALYESAKRGEPSAVRFLNSTPITHWRSAPYEAFQSTLEGIMYNRHAGEAESRAAARAGERGEPSGTFLPELYDTDQVIERDGTIREAPRPSPRFRRTAPRSAAPSLDAEVATWPGESVTRERIREIIRDDPSLAEHYYREGLVTDA